MASVVDHRGVQAEMGRGPDQSEEALGKMRSVVILGLRSQGYDFRAIGKVMNLSDRHVSRLYRAVPSPSRGYYAATATR